MIKNLKLELHPLGIQGSYTLDKLDTIPLSNYSYYRDKDRTLFSATSTLRAHLFLEKIVNHGSYGNLITANRITAGLIEPVMVKVPRLDEMNLTQEAILQSLCYSVLASEGAPWAIPKVHDIFLKEERPCFSMDQIKGKTVIEWFRGSTTPDRDFFLLIAQLSLLLWTLETKLNLDHRDLKADNLLLQEGSCSLKIASWTLECPFKVVILDFGFACLSSLVNLGDGVLPPMDPCPKEGRDLFQLLVSLVSIKPFISLLSNQTKEKIHEWLSVGDKSYASIASSWKPESWVYLVTGEKSFTSLKCRPMAILDTLSLPEHLNKTV